MAKITVYIPEPKEEYDVSNQRQVLEALHKIVPVLEFEKYTLLTIATADVDIVTTVFKLVSAKDFIAFLYLIVMIKNN